MASSYFSNILTEGQAYWLGMMFADGNLSVQASGRKVVSMCQKDRVVLDSFRTALSSPFSVGYRTKMKPDGVGKYEWHVINIYDDQMFDDLNALGCTPAKSKTLCPPTIPSELDRHFVRGYNDGDGGVYRYRGRARLRMRGTEALLEWVQKKMPAKSNLYAAGPTAQLFSDGKFAIINLEWLYRDSIYAVKSKRDLALELTGN